MCLTLMICMINCKENKKIKIYEDNFYTRNVDDKKKILPLKKPYFLSKLSNDPWEIDLTNAPLPKVRVDQICFSKDDSYLTGFGKWGNLYKNGDTLDIVFYFIIDLHNKLEFVYKDSVSYNNEIKKKKFHSDRCYGRNAIDNIYESFYASGKLPWYSEK